MTIKEMLSKIASLLPQNVYEEKYGKGFDPLTGRPFISITCSIREGEHFLLEETGSMIEGGDIFSLEDETRAKFFRTMFLYGLVHLKYLYTESKIAQSVKQ